MARPSVTPMKNNIAKDWYKSSFCTNQANCVQVRFHVDGKVDVRNSNDPNGPVVSFDQDEWKAFLGGVGLGEFNGVDAA